MLKRFRNVFLVGCDFRMTSESGYFFNEERTKQAVTNNTNSGLFAVQPSLSENLGGTIESLLMECPTVATRVGGMTDSVVDGVTGVLVNPSDPESLASGILRLLRDRPSARRYGVAGRERIYLDRFWNEFSADPRRFGEASRVHYAALYALPGAMHSGFSQFAAFDQDAIGQQKEAIRQIKSRGGFVIMSTHTARPINTSEVLLIARSAAERGADYVKMVVRTRSQEDQDELVRASLALRKESSIPFILMPMGHHTVATRLTLFTLGAGWAITQAEFVPGGFHQQPLIEAWLPIIRALRAS